jgi:integrase
MSADANPARKVTKPRRLPSTRRAVPDTRLAEINQVAVSTGNDPALDALLLRLHTETACRRGGALALCPSDLDPDQCLIRLREKGETVRWQPVSPTLMAHLQRHAAQRGAPHTANYCAKPTVGRSPPAATTTCGCASAAACRGWRLSRSARTGCGTRRQDHPARRAVPRGRRANRRDRDTPRPRSRNLGPCWVRPRHRPRHPASARLGVVRATWAADWSTPDRCAPIPAPRRGCCG